MPLDSYTNPNFHTSTLPDFQTTTLPHFDYHTSRLPHFHTSRLPHFQTSILPHFQTTTLPNFQTSRLPDFHTSTLPDFHTSTLLHFQSLPHFQTTKLPHFQTSTLPDFHTSTLPGRLPNFLHAYSTSGYIIMQIHVIIISKFLNCTFLSDDAFCALPTRSKSPLAGIFRCIFNHFCSYSFEDFLEKHAPSQPKNAPLSLFFKTNPINRDIRLIQTPLLAPT